MKKLVGIFVGLVTLISITWVNTAQAIPAFARKYEKPCSSCHTAWPLLNKAGRTFKEAGYRFPSEDQHSQKLKGITWGKNFPVSVIIKSRPYDKVDTAKDPKTRAIHEVEILIAGAIGKQWAGFLEYEGEDEGSFELEFGGTMVTWNQSKAFNVQLANAGTVFADPYDSYFHRRLTRGRAYVVDQSYGGADNGERFRGQRQSVSVYGRPISKLFYNVGIGAVSGDHEGESPETVFARVAFDITSKIMVGLLHIDGTCVSNGATGAGGSGNCLVDRDFERTGVDVQANVGNFQINSVYMKAKDDNATATGTVKNDAYYVQGIYVIKKGKRPQWVALLRYDNEEGADGTLERKAWTAYLSYYFKENIKGYLEYYTETENTIDPVAEHNRVTLQLEFGF